MNAYHGIELTSEDESILSFLLTRHDCYEYSIADRNDYAVMNARTAIAKLGCRATRSRAMPVA